MPQSVSAPASGWKRKLVFVWGGEFASVLTSSVLQMGLIWHVTLSTQSASALALITMASFLPMALLGAFAGAVVDRISVKRALVGADLFVAAVSLVLVFVAASGSLPVWVVVAVAFARAIGATLHGPAFNALTPFVAPPEMLTRLAGISQFMQSGGYILGTAIAAVIYPVFGLTAMVALDVGGALFATAAVVLSRVDTTVGPCDAPGAAEGVGRPVEEAADGAAAEGAAEDAAETAREAARGTGAEAAAVPQPSAMQAVRVFLSESAEGYRELKRHRGLFALLWIGFAFSVAFSPVAALFPLMTIGHFGGTTTDAAAAEIVFSVGMIAASAAIGATGGFKNRGFSCAFATVLFGAVTFASGILPPTAFLAFLAFSFVMGVATPLYSSPQVALMQERIPPDKLGRVFGMYGAVCSWAMPVGLLGTVALADLIGITTFFVMSGVAMTALGVVTWALPSVRRIDGRRDA